MTISFTRLLVAAAATALASTALAQERLKTLSRGNYECAMPGNASGKAWEAEPGKSFAIVSASRYESEAGDGIYLMRGDEVLFTRGPMKDMRMKRHSSGMLQRVKPDGTLGRLRCHRMRR